MYQELLLRMSGNTVLLISLLGYLLAAMRRVDSYHALMSLEIAGYHGFIAGRGDDSAGGAPGGG
ncbi:hypothetical protein F511_17281 [Dorcoceras hygrometricum]|uniref:Uncharacterized protein n=1 Tax=Dorcoceras hygrometricum TaxID=472368 RepID=A0A2Z7CDV0_9LAMI|nr:hypothetical protein F511_17281 [Dorcoceras hygrometricum]